MNVFVIEEQVAYEPGEVIGVYSTLDIAIEKNEEYCKEHRLPDGWAGTVIHEFTLDGERVGGVG